METVRDCLHLFGLRHGASWDEVNGAYRDLIRVWHPDRFHSDERLLKKANEQTAMLNLAMQKLRAEYKPAQPTSNTSSSSKQTSSSTQNSSTTAQKKTRPKAQSYQRGFESQDASQRARAFQLPPLLVRQRPLSSLGRILLGTAALILGFYTTAGALRGSSQAVFGSAIALFAITMIVKNLCTLLIRRPLVRVDAKGISSYDSGPIGWGELSEVTGTVTTGAGAINISCTPAYLASQTWAIKWVLRLRKLLRGAHYVVRCGGLDALPNDVVRAINAQHLTGHIDTTARVSTPDSHGAQWARLIGVLSALALMIRCSLGHPLTHIDFGFYFAVFATCQAYDITHRILRLPNGE